MRVRARWPLLFAFGVCLTSCSPPFSRPPQKPVAAKHFPISRADRVGSGSMASTDLRGPVAFEENRGQTDADVRYLARGDGYMLFLTGSGAVLSLRRGSGRPAGREPEALLAGVSGASDQNTPGNGAVIRMSLSGDINSTPRISGLEELPAKSNYYFGKDPSRWLTGVPSYAHVRYESVYPGIDLVYHGSAAQEIEYDFVVAPGADPDRIRFAFEGVEGISLDGAGNLVLTTAGGNVIHRAPLAYQDVDGHREIVASRFRIDPDARVGFEVAAYDGGRPLVIDPTLVFSTYLGGSEGGDWPVGIGTDDDGNIFVAGITVSTDFPTTADAAQPTHPSPASRAAGFLTKYDTSRQLVYSTYVGASNGAELSAMAVAGGVVALAGETASTDFPTTQGVYQPTHAGREGWPDVFVMALDASDLGIIFSTFLGGRRLEVPTAIAVDETGTVTVGGVTSGGLGVDEWDGTNDYPTTPGALRVDYSPLSAGTPPFVHLEYDGFISRLSSDGSTLLYSTYFHPIVSSLATAASGATVAAGGSSPPDHWDRYEPFPATPGAYRTTRAGDWEGWIAKLSGSGSSLEWGTFLGGSDADRVLSVAVRPDGSVAVAGDTSSSDFPTMTAWQENLAGTDAFVSVLSPDGSTLLASSFLGGSQGDRATSLTVVGVNEVAVCGSTASEDFPVRHAVQESYGGGTDDAFIAVVDTAAGSIRHATYLGGSSGEHAQSIAADPAGNLYVTGQTHSLDFPVVRPTQPFMAFGPSGSIGDAFVAVLSPENVLPDSPAEFEHPPTPPCGLLFTAPESEIRFTVQAADADSDDIVTLDIVGAVPNGAALDPPLPTAGNPVATEFSWTPPLTDTWSIRPLNFTAVSTVGAGDYCALWVIVMPAEQAAAAVR